MNYKELEVELFLRAFLPKDIFCNIIFAVGGYCRDQKLNIIPKDLDIVVEKPNGAHDFTHHLYDLFSDFITKPHQLGAEYPIWQIIFKNNIIFENIEYKTNGAVVEFADTMKEIFLDEFSRQRKTYFGTLKEDALRRDFSVNSLYKNLTTGEFFDITERSLLDISNGVLRENPNVDLDLVLSNDPLRQLRLVSLHCKYEWRIPKSVLRSVQKNAHRLKVVSAERIMGELEKVMKLGKLHKAVRLMKLTGLLEYIFPEILALESIKQHPKYHSEGCKFPHNNDIENYGNAFEHTMLVLKNAKAGVIPQMAALLHDIGKKATQEIKADNITFYGHEDVGAEMTEEILYRLKFDAKTIKEIKSLVKLHMRPLSLRSAGEKALRKFLREHGEYLELVLDLGEADCKGSIPENGVIYNYLPELRNRFNEIMTSPFQTTGKPVLNGEEIIALLEIKPSPIIGKVIAFLKDKEEELAVQKKALTKEEASLLVISNFKQKTAI